MLSSEVVVLLAAFGWGLVGGLAYLLAVRASVRRVVLGASLASSWLLYALRVSLAGTGFWWIAQGGLASNVVTALAGFLLARLLVQAVVFSR